MQKTEARAKSGRRPLGVLSNAYNNQGIVAGSRNNGGKWSSKPSSGKKLQSSPDKKMKGEKSSARRVEDAENDDSLDRLLLVQSDLSNLTRQIDEIVIEAFKVKEMSKQGRKEVECFASFLSEMVSSLKPWAPRLQKALGKSPEESEKLMESSPLNTKPQGGDGGNIDDDDDDESILISSPEPCELDTLISPSPLVSWRANCTVERARQVFLLTPLPMSKALSPKCQKSSTSVLENIASTTASFPSLMAVSDKRKDDLLQDEAEHPASNLPSEEPGFVSPFMLRKKDYSVLMVTPRFKLSPPKSCALLQPVSESSHWKDCHARKATPFPVRILSNIGEESSESAGSEASDDLAAKYPELLGIQQAQKLGLEKKESQSSLKWLFSPPKSCILMEPPDDEPVDVATDIQHLASQEAEISIPKVDLAQGSCQRTQKQVLTESRARNLLLIESTPVWKDPQSTFGKGKRQGETTLKKELWTRFEAASFSEFRLRGNEALDSETKGFLDRLDEV